MPDFEEPGTPNQTTMPEVEEPDTADQTTMPEVNSTRQDSTSMNLMTEVIKCDAIKQSKLIKTWL